MGRRSGVQLPRNQTNVPGFQAGREPRICLVQLPTSSNVGVPLAVFLTFSQPRIACIPLWMGKLTTFRAEGRILRSYILSVLLVP